MSSFNDVAVVVLTILLVAACVQISSIGERLSHIHSACYSYQEDFYNCSKELIVCQKDNVCKCDCGNDSFWSSLFSIGFGVIIGGVIVYFNMKNG